ncbi:MAG: FAD-dependent oxidoreductase [Opitutaceae bacterium]|nr:FAD-dependent oxidoreductase [Opitutaceae bacterium]
MDSPAPRPPLSRRHFLSGAASLATYSLIVRAPSTLSAQYESGPIQREAIAPRIDTLAPDDARTGGVAAEPNLRRVELDCDVLVAGGGLAGVCAAISAARLGSRVVLVQDRSRLGGNASSEVRMHPMGSRYGFREGGLIEEFSLENAYRNEHHAWELWDLMLYDRVVREPNLRLLLDSSVYRVEKEGDKIRSAWVRCDKTEHLYQVKAPIYIDCTGDGRLGLEAGAEFKLGREASTEFGESLADYDKPGTTQGSSILFTARRHDRPMPFEAPSWARSLSEEDFFSRNVGPETWSYGYWWIELGGVYDTIRDNERLRFELLAIVLGVWDYIKNGGKYPESANWALETVGMIPGKRESRRFLGDTILTQHDLEGKWKEFPDGVAFGGWPMDDHPALGFDAKGQKPYKPIKPPTAYNIPFGSLYSRNVPNLLLAGRNISATHVAFSSIRVMKTCAVIGQAAGTAAQRCAAGGILPRALRNDPARVKDLQQQLLKDGALILGLDNQDAADHARRATVTASASSRNSAPHHILSGQTYATKDDVQHRWIAPLGEKGAWIQLEWIEPVTLAEIQLIHDTGLHRGLTISASPNEHRQAIAGPQPEVNRDYKVIGILPDGSERSLAAVTLNYQRLRRHRFDPVRLKAVKILIERTQGAPEVSLYEVRAYS